MSPQGGLNPNQEAIWSSSATTSIFKPEKSTKVRKELRDELGPRFPDDVYTYNAQWIEMD
ncbi:MAG: hypothetical protein IPK03_17540 [Bacteroidetes bacterium]|nr:hypothetical protein [Bacteroidota bacterium]